MDNSHQNLVELKNYKKPEYSIKDVHLTFDLHSTNTLVKSKLNIKCTKDGIDSDLVLNGEELILEKVIVDGEELSKDFYQVSNNQMIISGLGKESFTLEIENRVNPEVNKALSGLYKSGSIFCTQNEAEGFRRITFYPDRPDVMSVFTTKIIADKKEFPILLSNGNLTEEGVLENGKHFAVWHDPFPKPCYLYALVAGDLGMIQDSFKTMSGRDIDLRIYCDKGNESKCYHAMESLKKSMTWDEEKFGLEYDLDIYMIVAVDSFNMGAMENKGLNIFNSVYVLADSSTATDSNFLAIESVIGHEYFHNWTGNRITCRDWFQLTLKEGLTVYRDQEFSADLHSRVVQRVQDVGMLRVAQYPEDGGPTAHPIKPASYIEINNFYTATIYNKGAEVIRMIENFLGVDGFRKGMDKYFELFDGQAVTTEDFVHAMSIANNNFDFEQFKRWYSQAGTPKVKVMEEFNDGEYKLTIEQELTDSPKQSASDKKPHHFPLVFGLLDNNGNEVQLDNNVLEIKDYVQTFTFQVEEKPVLSLNRGFSAPIVLDMERSLEDLYFLMTNDKDGFNRVEAATRAAYAMVDKFLNGAKSLDETYINAFAKILNDKTIDAAYKALMINLPGTDLIGQEYDVVDFPKIAKARNDVMKCITASLEKDLMSIYTDNKPNSKEFQIDGESMGKRALRSAALTLLCRSDNEELLEIAKKHFNDATNMTDEFNSLNCLAGKGGSVWADASAKFYKKFETDTLVMQKWLSVEASVDRDDILERLQELEGDKVYDKTVPNLVRSLWGSFSRNHSQFHHESGRGYKAMAEKILEVDKLNPQLASRLSSAFRVYKKLDTARQVLVKKQLEVILAEKDLSKNVFEIIDLTIKS
jgi:aminopeptidase N